MMIIFLCSDFPLLCCCYYCCCSRVSYSVRWLQTGYEAKAKLELLPLFQIAGIYICAPWYLSTALLSDAISILPKIKVNC